MILGWRGERYLLRVSQVVSRMWDSVASKTIIASRSWSHSLVKRNAKGRGRILSVLADGCSLQPIRSPVIAMGGTKTIRTKMARRRDVDLQLEQAMGHAKDTTRRPAERAQPRAWMKSLSILANGRGVSSSGQEKAGGDNGSWSC